MRMNRKLYSSDNIFMTLLLFTALLVCITLKFNSQFILVKNLLLYFLKYNTTTKKIYPNGVRKSRYQEEGVKGGEECSVCLCDMKQGDEIMKLPCHHFFHAFCLDKWLVSYGHLTCPFCRASLSLSSSSSSSSSSSLPSSGDTPVLFSESEVEVLSFNFLGSTRGRNSWGLL